MGLIVCGWCGQPTKSMERCDHCHHEDPARPWLQRGEEPRSGELAAIAGIALRLVAAQQELIAAGRKVTVEALAEVLEVDARTVRRWRQRSA